MFFLVNRSLAKRRNKWICALKLSLAKVKMFGPGGNPDAKSTPTQYTLVPWEQVQPDPHSTRQDSSSSSILEPKIPEVWTFSDHNTVMCT